VGGIRYVIEHDVPIAAMLAWLAGLLDADARPAKLGERVSISSWVWSSLAEPQLALMLAIEVPSTGLGA
jgi:hypothetical protein